MSRQLQIPFGPKVDTCSECPKPAVYTCDCPIGWQACPSSGALLPVPCRSHLCRSHAHVVDRFRARWRSQTHAFAIRFCSRHQSNRYGAPLSRLMTDDEVDAHLRRTA